MAVFDIFGFTDDGDRVKIGELDIPEPGFTVVIPAGYTPDAYLMVSVNGGTAQTMSSLLAGGRTLNNIESLYFTSSDSTRGVRCQIETNSSSKTVYLTWPPYNHDAVWKNNEPFNPFSKIESALLEFWQNIEFVTFTVNTYEVQEK